MRGVEKTRNFKKSPKSDSSHLTSNSQAFQKLTPEKPIISKRGTLFGSVWHGFSSGSGSRFGQSPAKGLKNGSQTGALGICALWRKKRGAGVGNRSPLGSVWHLHSPVPKRPCSLAQYQAKCHHGPQTSTTVPTSMAGGGGALTGPPPWSR
jgi:hypothetical protein